MGKVRKPLLSHHSLLTKNDFTLWPVQRSPLLHPTLQGAQNALVVMLRVMVLQIVEQSGACQVRLVLQQRKQFCIPDCRQRILPGAPVPLGLIAGNMW